jgi:Flp pilus assembly protein TadB
MNVISASPGETVIVYTWIDSPMIVALVFALAGACFVSIYFLRRRRK